MLNPYPFEGISQYRWPLCAELSGRTLSLVMDNGTAYTIAFLDGSRMRLEQADGIACTEAYDCLKVDDDVYFVNTEHIGEKSRVGLTLALDLSNMLVTSVKAGSHTDREPGIFFTKAEITFGAIRKQDGSFEVKRHFYTADLVGKAIRWDYTSDFSIIHTYPSERYYRPILVQNGAEPDRDVAAILNDKNRRMPWPDIGSSAVDWVKIREGIYLLNMIETSHPEMLAFPKKNCLTFVFNLKRMLNFGRAFGYIDSVDEKENYVFSAYGSYVDMEPLHEECVFNYDL